MNKQDEMIELYSQEEQLKKELQEIDDGGEILDIKKRQKEQELEEIRTIIINFHNPDEIEKLEQEKMNWNYSNEQEDYDMENYYDRKNN